MKWIEQTNERKRIILDEASARLKALNNAVEKDLWVTVALKAIFNTPIAKDIVFKGGTSLSKSWKLIQRFSEDIDLAINREALGFGGEISN
ncbi:nucleotidyl transferase AbiEii/AbiGii toxin family protein, partial [Sediminibacterium salmoneum]|uniref:nucleotidyl transferase AbiEii/AbiGii toxin family protein n=1 Tax=Sediminibacterium salmoneum TaxID=426421 RepID=UPI0004794D15